MMLRYSLQYRDSRCRVSWARCLYHKFETMAFSWRGNWPGWLPTVLELNYLGVINQELKPAFVIQYAALEVLVAGIEGEPTSILSAQLDERKRTNLLEGIRLVLRRYSL